SNANPTTGVTPQVCVTAGEVDLTLDAGLIFPASIGDFVWNDLNGNGLQDPGEPGIPGVTVNLLDNTTGAVLQTTTTDANGKYLFNVAPGCYKVAFIKPTGYSFTLQNVGSDPAINSNADPVTGITPQVCVTSGQNDLTIDAGLTQPASIGDFVWNDLNGNGLQDASEPGIAGVTVNLLDNATGAILQTTTTDANGKYLFNVNPGCYKVAFVKPTGYIFTLQNVGSDPAINSNVNPITGITPQVCVTSGQSDLTIDAGLYKPALLGDYVWEDLNMNGIQDPGEPGFYNATVNLLNSFGQMVATTRTDANGKYLFAVAPGCYSIQVIRPSGYMFTTQNAGTDPTKLSAVNPTTGITAKVCLESGQQNLNLDAGIYLIPCDFRQAVNDLIESVALEETGLAHIINAEGEKIQAAMALKFSEADLLNINSSVTETLKIISKLEILLQYKLEITDGICPK
ncbi:MAG: SdrD B-like domain-containing protein, partial [Sarcina sp.]